MRRSITTMYAQLLSVAVVLALPAQAVHSSTITILSDNISDNFYIGSGGSITGRFDLTSLIAGNQIVSASFEVIATDDGDQVYSSESYTAYNYWYSACSGYSCIHYLRDHTRYIADEVESSVIMFEGATSATSQSSYYTNSIYTHQTLDDTWNSCHRWTFGVCTDRRYYYRHTDHYDNFSGYAYSLNASGVLGEAEINGALADGYLDFQIAASSGDFILNSVTLTLETTPVPLPAAAWLLGSGLLGLIGVAKRRRSDPVFSLSLR